MKKSILFCMSALLMLSVGMTGCSSDDDGIDYESLDDNHKNIIGEWQLLYYKNGLNYRQLDSGEVTLTFTKNEIVKVKGANAENEYNFFPIQSGCFKYYFEEVTLGKAKEPITYLMVDKSSGDFTSKYNFSFEDGWLVLWDIDIYDGGYEYRLKKVE